MSTIPASTLVRTNPSVLAAGGSALQIIALMLTTSTRVPIGTVSSFPDGPAVESYFGSGSQEASCANRYFAGFNGANKLPGAVLFAQYPTSAVVAYLRGGSVASLTLPQLQALSGSLTVIVDGYARPAASINLSSATGFSSAAALIQTGLNGTPTTLASFTGSVGASVTGSISGTTLTVSAVGQGVVRVGATLAGTGVTASTKITALGSGIGGTGTYTVDTSQTAGSTTITCSDNTLNVTVVASGTLAVGQTIPGAANAVITALGTGVGLTGTYILNGAQQQVNSGSLTATGTPVAVTYDSQSGAFIVASGITGAPSTIAFATGTLAAGVKLTSVTGAVTSQGAAIATPAAFMNGIVAVTQAWVTYMTLFDPDGGSGNTLKEAFALWKDAFDDRYGYACWDTDVTPTTQVPASSSLGVLLPAASDSGTCLIWAPDATVGPLAAAFVCGTAASIDFTEENGRISFAYRWQDGMTAWVTDATVAANLTANGYNYGGAFATAADDFLFFQNGQCTGAFKWFDSYINQVWLNDAIQVDELTLLQNVKSIPYSDAGNVMIEAGIRGTIDQGLTFGAFGPDAITPAQAVEVNTSAGVNISDTLQTQGWYLQVLPALPAVRAARTSPPITFWFIDQGAVQKLNIATIEVQ